MSLISISQVDEIEDQAADDIELNYRDSFCFLQSSFRFVFRRDWFKYSASASDSSYSYVHSNFKIQGNLNLITQALEAVGCRVEVIPDPTTVHFHLPNHLLVRVHREYDKFIEELTSYFPHEKDGILKFYGECWKIFNALNSLELKSLEEPLYLFGQFFQKPLECLTIAYYLLQNAGAIARKYIQDPQLLSFIDAECFIVSTVNALQTAMINASMLHGGWIVKTGQVFNSWDRWKGPPERNET
ncbi:prolycopene isomerase, chloroplastic-like isoform X2 [Trifolium pratense]|uniref:prolycopene isomerase, chloroplastic-like isoform X2 n=1 Tax=Trifolium pratense TaxID=57577 RepID=UPI001E6975DF|nr:prolycopene isomerase, chloroplastic-like isoform X2 [Trifolium pratense]